MFPQAAKADRYIHIFLRDSNTILHLLKQFQKIINENKRITKKSHAKSIRNGRAFQKIQKKFGNRKEISDC